MNKLGFLILSISVFQIIFSGCKQDEINLDEFSNRIRVDRQIAIPLIYGQLKVDDILSRFETSPLLIDGDTVEVVFGVDSINFVEDQELVFTDTINIRDSANFENTTVEIETAKIHVKFKNYFPIGVNIEILLYDAISETVLDTINLNPEDGYYIKPSPVNSNGDVLVDEVKEYKDAITIKEQTLENLMHVATHFILNFEMEIVDSESVNSVKIPSTSTLDFHFGLEAEGAYVKN